MASVNSSRVPLTRVSLGCARRKPTAPIIQIGVRTAIKIRHCAEAAGASDDGLSLVPQPRWPDLLGG